MVDVRVQIINGDNEVASETARIKAKDDGDDHNEKIMMTYPAAAIRATTKLRITMTTKDY